MSEYHLYHKKQTHLMLLKKTKIIWILTFNKHWTEIDTMFFFCLSLLGDKKKILHEQYKRGLFYIHIFCWLDAFLFIFFLQRMSWEHECKTSCGNCTKQYNLMLCNISLKLHNHFNKHWSEMATMLYLYLIDFIHTKRVNKK